MYTLDTNALIYAVKADERATPILRDILARPDVAVYVSTITEIELFSFPQLSEEETHLIENFLSKVSLIPVDSQIARPAGTIRSAYRIKLPDSAIAATALFTGSTLLTRNVADFERVPTLRVEAI